ncbi:MAG: helix-turn-helix transcriptional regulator, partial [Rikenellaceae bacterium]
MTINERIGLILKEKKLTANEFAASLEVRSSNISHIITGRNKPSFDFLEKLSSVFPDISTLWLIKGDGDMYLSDNK